MDLAKLTATLLAHGGSPADYVGDGKVPGPIAPLICVPTTAGTGSEVSAASVITDTENHIKVGILSNYLRPAVAVVDPLLTVSCPPEVTAASGMDALTQCIEPFVSPRASPLSDAVAREGIRRAAAGLRPAYASGTDLAARADMAVDSMAGGMALAALLAGLAFSNVGVAVVHALEYPVGGAVHCSHGCGNGLLLPFVMRFNLPARKREFAEIARLLGEEPIAERAITAVEKLRADIGIPPRLRDIGCREEQLRPFAEKAFGIKRILRVNPRAVTVDDLHGILREAY